MTMTWQDISSAPKDGTRVLFYFCRQDVAVSGCWHTERERNDPSGYEPGWSWWTTDDDLIVMDGGPDDTPDLWMPLPPPPETSNG